MFKYIVSGGRKTEHLRRSKTPRKSLAILTTAPTYPRGIIVSPSILSPTLSPPNGTSPPAPHRLPRRPARPRRYHPSKKARTAGRVEAGLILQGPNQPGGPKGPALPADPGKQRRRPPHPSPPHPGPPHPSPSPPHLKPQRRRSDRALESAAPRRAIKYRSLVTKKLHS